MTSIGVMVHALRVRFFRVAGLLESFLRAVVERVCGVRPEVVITGGIDPDYGRKDLLRDRVMINYKSFTDPRLVVYVLFHEACHNIVDNVCFGGDAAAHLRVYRRLLSSLGYDRVPEEVVCDRFGRECAEAMPRWVLDCIGSVSGPGSAFFVLAGSFIGGRPVEWGYDRLRLLVKKLFEEEKAVRKCIDEAAVRHLPAVSGFMKKELCRAVGELKH